MTELVDKYVVLGTPDDVREGLHEFLDAGVQDFVIGSIHERSLIENAIPSEMETKAAMDTFAWYAEELLPFLHDTAQPVADQVAQHA